MATLEADAREVKATLGRTETLLRGSDDRLRRVETDLAEVKGKVSQLPTARMLLAGGSALVLAAFGLAFVLVRFGLPY